MTFEDYVKESLGRHESKLDKIDEKVTNLRVRMAVISATVAGIVSLIVRALG